MATTDQHEAEFLAAALAYAENPAHVAYIESRLPNSGKTLQEICEEGQMVLDSVAPMLVAALVKDLH